MPRWLHIIVQIATLGLGSYISYKTGTPLPLVISSGGNAVIGVIQQSYNTDGTPQTVPFQKPSDQVKIPNPNK